MKKLLIILFLLPFAVFGQTEYNLKYDTIGVGKPSGTSGVALFGKVYLKNVSAGLSTDSALVVRNGRIFKFPAIPTLSFGTFGSTPNAEGGSYAAGVITLQPASASFPGGVTTGTQTFAGEKTIQSSGSGNTLSVNHASGDGAALNITKGGNGEGIYVNKTSGSGNAATIIGTLNATTLVKSGGTSSEFLMADGSVNTSVLPSGAYLPLSGGTLTGALTGTSATFSNTSTTNQINITNSVGGGVSSIGNDITGDLLINSPENIYFQNLSGTNSLIISSKGEIKLNSDSTSSFTGAGNVLIGTTSDAGFKLDVNGTARLGALTGTSATFSGNIGIGSPPTQAAQLDLFGGDELALKTYSGFGNRAGGDFLVNSYRLPGASLFQRVTDLVSLGDDVNNRESIFRFITTNTSNSTDTRFTIKGNELVSTVPLSGTSATFSSTISASNLTSGTYTPTLTNVTNVDSSTPLNCQYTRVGNIVTVFGRLEVDPTVALTQTDIGISLPISSNISTPDNLNGHGNAMIGTGGGGAAVIIGDATNDRATFSFFSSGTSSTYLNFSFSYQVL